MLLGGLLKVFAILVRCGDADDAVAPCLLGGGDMLFGKCAHLIDSNLNLRWIPARKEKGRILLDPGRLNSDLRPKFSSVTARNLHLAERLRKPEIGGTHGGERGLRPEGSASGPATKPYSERLPGYSPLPNSSSTIIIYD